MWTRLRERSGIALVLIVAAALGLGFAAAAAKKPKPAHHASQTASKGSKAKIAAKGSKGKLAYNGRRKGSLAKAKATALAKAKVGTRHKKGSTPETTSATVTPPSAPARDLFGAQKVPSPLAARSIGSYAHGCLAGGQMLPVDGAAWQAMRLSRNRNWGHPRLVAYVERLAKDSQELDHWPGLLVGDMAQPMGGPMVSGHASHQIGLDADIWLKPMPPKTLTAEERESISADTVVADDQVSIKPDIWQPGHVQLLKRAASYPEVARIFVHPAIKKKLCESAGTDRAWLSKIRPWWGHNYHFHVRLTCPPGGEGCEDQVPAGSDDGCGKELEGWLKRMQTPIIAKVPPVQRALITMAQLPAECSRLVGYVPPPPVPMGPPLPERKTDAKTAAKPQVPAPTKDAGKSPGGKS
jgi:penicillin-insensitive murein DD-endopeptidase